MSRLWVACNPRMLHYPNRHFSKSLLDILDLRWQQGTKIFVGRGQRRVDQLLGTRRESERLEANIEACFPDIYADNWQCPSLKRGE
jgi:hypothetical protein